MIDKTFSQIMRILNTSALYGDTCELTSDQAECLCQKLAPADIRKNKLEIELAAVTEKRDWAFNEIAAKRQRIEQLHGELRAANETCEQLRAELHAALNDLQARRLMDATMDVDEPPFPLTADVNRAFAQEGD